MSCVACEQTVERAALACAGITSAHADHIKGTLSVHHQSALDASALNVALQESSYWIEAEVKTETEAPPDESALSDETLPRASSPEKNVLGEEPPEAPTHTPPQQRRSGNTPAIIVIVLGLFVIARELGLTQIFQAVPVVGSDEVGYVALFALGLLTSLHCIAMCGGINLAQSSALANGEHLGESALVTHGKAHAWAALRPSLGYNAGRLVSYTLIGALLGLVGSALVVSVQTRGIIGIAAGAFMLIMGISFLGGYAPLKRATSLLPNQAARRVSHIIRAFARKGPFALGLANGFMPCGPLQAMQLYAVATGSVCAGALSMLSFCAGTIPLVLAAGVIASSLRLSWRARMQQASGVLLMLFGLFMATNSLALIGIGIPGIIASSSSSDSGVATAEVIGGVQYVTTVVEPNAYGDIQVEAGTPLIWTFSVDEQSLNGCNSTIVIPAFNQEIALHAGQNTVSFTPQEPGTYTYSCWMGMIKGTITVV